MNYMTRACAGKTRYTSAGEARAAMRDHKGIKGLFTYRCTECGGWHYGHGKPLHRPAARIKNWTWRKAAQDE